MVRFTMCIKSKQNVTKSGSQCTIDFGSLIGLGFHLLQLYMSSVTVHRFLPYSSIILSTCRPPLLSPRDL
jgi:hypothetical protein